jgi:hypothetical protein
MENKRSVGVKLATESKAQGASGTLSGKARDALRSRELVHHPTS